MPKVRDSLLLEGMIVVAIILFIAITIIPNVPVLRDFFGFPVVQSPLAK